MTRPLRIAQFGTFELENFGDLLFPLVLEHALRARLGEVELVLFSPLAGPFPGDPTVAVHAIDGAGLSRAGLDALVVGGGDLISLSENIASVYDERWSSPISAHAACWAVPAVHRPPRMPVVWNAPGVPHPFTAAQAPIVWDLCSEVDYLSVRDEQSRDHLLATGVEREIEVVPDTALLLPQLLPDRAAADRAHPHLDGLGLSPGGYVVFQIAPHLLEKLGVGGADVAGLLSQVERALGVRTLLLPIGYCHDDHTALSVVRDASPDLAYLEPRLAPLEIAAMIACSAGFIGSSYHGAVTALAYDRPFLMVNSGRLTKLDGLARWTGREDVIAACWEELALRAPKLAPAPGAEERRRGLCARVEAHFDRLAKVVSASRLPATEGGGRNSGAEHLRELRERLLTQDLMLQRERHEAERERTTHEMVIARLRERLDKRRRWRSLWR